MLSEAVSTPLGTLISYPFIQSIDRKALGLMLAFSAGALLCVGATHLLPAVEKESKGCTIPSLLAVILIAFIIVMTKGKNELRTKTNNC